MAEGRASRGRRGQAATAPTGKRQQSLAAAAKAQALQVLASRRGGAAAGGGNTNSIPAKQQVLRLAAEAPATSGAGAGDGAVAGGAGGCSSSSEDSDDDFVAPRRGRKAPRVAAAAAAVATPPEAPSGSNWARSQPAAAGRSPAGAPGSSSGLAQYDPQQQLQGGDAGQPASCELSVVVFEEVDVLLDTDPRFLPTILPLIEASRIPILMTCSSSTTPSHLPAALRAAATVQPLQLTAPAAADLLQLLVLVAVAEGLVVELPLLQQLVMQKVRGPCCSLVCTGTYATSPCLRCRQQLGSI